MSKGNLALSLIALLFLNALGRPLQLSPGSVQDPPDLSVYPWLYLRDNQEIGVDEQPVELIVLGDVMLGRGVAADARTLSRAASWLGTADVTFANLECVISEAAVGMNSLPESADQPYRLIAPPSAAKWLANAGVDILSLANNHALDEGPDGLAEMVSLLNAAGMGVTGAGSGLDTAFSPVFRSVGGIQLAFLAFNAVSSPDRLNSAQEDGWVIAGWDQDRAVRAIQSARESSDAVIVSMHWGYEYRSRVDPAQREIARVLLDAGADLVVGHHPHVVQGSAARLPGGDMPDQFVAYSLGNFIFDQLLQETRLGLALRVFIDLKGLRGVQALPVSSGPRPRLLEPHEASGLLDRIRPEVEPLYIACDRLSCYPVEGHGSNGSGVFTAGMIDLTGDQIHEQVRLKAGQISIRQGHQEVWRSPAEWQVLDLALGDPNGDGRAEILAAFLKPDSTGVLHSHPFILGQREGIYRTLWGGSAVSRPIREVELGDLDGDGLQELIVLEMGRDEGLSAVSVWRWHGWGFSQQWRSPEGHYENLVFTPARNGNPAAIQVTPSLK